MKLGLAMLRGVIGVVFMGHGLQKLAGWFGGPGLDKTAAGFDSMDLRPGRAHATTASVSETVGGALLAAGLITPVAASLISGTMITAIRKVHAKNGFWVANGGYEFNLALLAIAFALADVGPGEWSLDEVLGIRLRGPFWALAQLGAGLLGSTAAIELGKRYPQPSAPDQDASRDGQAPRQPVPEPSPASAS